jgi:hypothetical protein
MDLLSVGLYDSGGCGGGDGGGNGGGTVAAADEFRVINAMYTWVKFATSAEL